MNYKLHYCQFYDNRTSHIASHATTVTRSELERSGRKRMWPKWSTILTFVWRDWGKSWILWRWSPCGPKFENRTFRMQAKSDTSHGNKLGLSRYYQQHEVTSSAVLLTFYSLLVTWYTNSLTFNNCTFCPHCIYVFCIYLRTNSDLCHLQHKLIGFCNLDEKCLQRGTDWGFK